MSDGVTDKQLANCLRATAEYLEALDLHTGAKIVRLAADRLEAKAATIADHGTPAITINEHAHGDDAA